MWSSVWRGFAWKSGYLVTIIFIIKGSCCGPLQAQTTESKMPFEISEVLKSSLVVSSPLSPSYSASQYKLSISFIVFLIVDYVFLWSAPYCVNIFVQNRRNFCVWVSSCWSTELQWFLCKHCAPSSKWQSHSSAVQPLGCSKCHLLEDAE